MACYACNIAPNKTRRRTHNFCPEANEHTWKLKRPAGSIALVNKRLISEIAPSRYDRSQQIKEARGGQRSSLSGMRPAAATSRRCYKKKRFHDNHIMAQRKFERGQTNQPPLAASELMRLECSWKENLRKKSFNDRLTGKIVRFIWTPMIEQHFEG